MNEKVSFSYGYVSKVLEGVLFVFVLLLVLLVLLLLNLWYLINYPIINNIYLFIDVVDKLR